MYSYLEPGTFVCLSVRGFFSFKLANPYKPQVYVLLHLNLRRCNLFSRQYQNFTYLAGKMFAADGEYKWMR